MNCPRCGCGEVNIQNVQTGTFTTGTNRVVIQAPEKTKGCLYWISCWWMVDILKYFFVGWWWRLLFGRYKYKDPKNYSKTEAIFETRATCQNCGYTWRVK